MTAHYESHKTEDEDDESRKAEDEDKLYLGRGLFMNIRNIGVGSANKISVRWTFPMKKTVKYLNKIAQGDSALSFSHGKVRVSLNNNTALVGWTPHQIQSIDCITAIPNKGSKFLLDIPNAYGIVVSAIIFYNEMSNEPRDVKIPVLRMDLKYTDIGQHEYKTTFDIHFNPALRDGLSGEIIYGFLEHKQRKSCLVFDAVHRFIHGRVILPSPFQ